MASSNGKDNVLQLAVTNVIQYLNKKQQENDGHNPEADLAMISMNNVVEAMNHLVMQLSGLQTAMNNNQMLMAAVLKQNGGVYPIYQTTLKRLPPVYEIRSAVDPLTKDVRLSLIVISEDNKTATGIILPPGS